jgi:hypothetical protein
VRYLRVFASCVILRLNFDSAAPRPSSGAGLLARPARELLAECAAMSLSQRNLPAGLNHQRGWNGDRSHFGIIIDDELAVAGK